MALLIEPENEEALAEAVADCLSDGRTLRIIGQGTKEGFGRPVAADGTLSCARMTGIDYYQPGELVLEAAAGTPLAEIEAILAENGQRLAFEPPDLAPLYGGAPGEATIGGVVACNLSGPGRPFGGAARDHVLGIRAISGRAESFASGGRVVKNVTGYDMSKLLTGAFGTLAVLSRVTLKVLPRPEVLRTVLVFGLSPADAAEVMADVLGGQWEVSAAAYLPEDRAKTSRVRYVTEAGSSVAAFRLGGSRAGVAARVGALRNGLKDRADTEELHSSNSVTLWKEIGAAALIGGGADDVLWRLSLPPASGLDAAEDIRRELGGAYFADWGGGLVWAALPSLEAENAADGAAARLRAIAESHGGQATLIRAPFEMRHRVPVFHPLPGPVAALSRRIKQNFDPQGVLNPGRMVEGL